MLRAEQQRQRERLVPSPLCCMLAAAVRRRLDYDDDKRLLNSAQVGGDEVSTDSINSGAKLDLELERPPPACEAEIITRAQASARAAAARRRLDYDDDKRLLNAAQVGGGEVSTDSNNCGAKLDLELERPKPACEADV